MTEQRLSFASFWDGSNLSGYEAACISSFVAQGHSFTVYSYRAIENLPAGVTLGDARDVTDEADLTRFLINGRANLSHFSDLFRYQLFERTDHAWVDLDMMALRPVDVSPTEDLLAKEDATSLCGAIMRLAGNPPALSTLIAKTKAMRDRDLVWGETGPRLLTSVFNRRDVFEKAHTPEFFFPIHYNDSWKMLLPEFKDECMQLCRSAFTVHLWNDRLVKIGLWKDYCPPVGSFLETHFRAYGCMDYFQGIYPERVMHNMVENWRMRCEGGDIGLGQWMRRAVPSAKLTYRRRLNLPT